MLTSEGTVYYEKLLQELVYPRKKQYLYEEMLGESRNKTAVMDKIEGMVAEAIKEVDGIVRKNDYFPILEYDPTIQPKKKKGGVGLIILKVLVFLIIFLIACSIAIAIGGNDMGWFRELCALAGAAMLGYAGVQFINYLKFKDFNYGDFAFATNMKLLESETKDMIEELHKNIEKLINAER